MQMTVPNTGNGGGSGGRICVHLNDQFTFHGELTAIGGTAEDVKSIGAPGTVYVESTVGSDVTTHVWVDNANRPKHCDQFKVLIDVSPLSNLHPMRQACVGLSKASISSHF